MNNRRNKLHFQRGQLLERIANQRGEIKSVSLPAQGLLRRTDTVIDYSKKTAGFISDHLETFIVIGTILLIKRPKRAINWARRGFFAWNIWRSLNKNLDLLNRLSIK